MLQMQKNDNPKVFLCTESLCPSAAELLKVRDSGEMLQKLRCVWSMSMHGLHVDAAAALQSF